MVTGSALPALLDPAEGFVASANNRPHETPAVAVSFFFSPDDRVRRLRQLLAAPGPVAIAGLKALQHDVYMPSALVLRDALIVLAPPEVAGGTVAQHLTAWDGVYGRESVGALAFELAVHHFADHLHGPENLAIYTATWDPWALLRQDLETLPRERLSAAVGEAMVRAEADVARLGTWGAAHRLRLSHVLGALPVVGRRWRFADAPADGGNETVMKTAHGFTAGRHAVRLAANARHVHDMADPDANWFVLLGGQDGMAGSVAFLDQWDLWRQRAMMHLPLRAESLSRAFPYRTTVRPARPGQTVP